MLLFLSSFPISFCDLFSISGFLCYDREDKTLLLSQCSDLPCHSFSPKCLAYFTWLGLAKWLWLINHINHWLWLIKINHFYNWNTLQKLPVVYNSKYLSSLVINSLYTSSFLNMPFFQESTNNSASSTAVSYHAQVPFRKEPSWWNIMIMLISSSAIRCNISIFFNGFQTSYLKKPPPSLSAEEWLPQTTQSYTALEQACQ